MSKQIPNLQVALDHSDLQGAIKAAVSVGHEVDVIEAGTVCLCRWEASLLKCSAAFSQRKSSWLIPSVRMPAEP